MKVKDALHTVMITRQTGITNAMVKLCKENDGTLICGHEEHAHMMRKTHGIKTIGINHAIEGLNGPFFWDNYALRIFLECQKEKAQKIRRLLDE